MKLFALLEITLVFDISTQLKSFVPQLKLKLRFGYKFALQRMTIPDPTCLVSDPLHLDERKLVSGSSLRISYLVAVIKKYPPKASE